MSIIRLTSKFELIILALAHLEQVSYVPKLIFTPNKITIMIIMLRLSYNFSNDVLRPKRQFFKTILVLAYLDEVELTSI